MSPAAWLAARARWLGAASGRWRGAATAGDMLLLGAAVLLAAALADPGLTLMRPRPALVVTLDITQSMAVPDADDPLAPGALRPRGEAARRALHQALALLPCGSQLGWAVFTEYRSFLLLAPVEVCAHLAELRGTLAAMDNRMAWAGNSEVAKGLHSAWEIAGKLPGPPALVFVTDGHEAPPLNPRHRPHFDNDKPGERAGLLVGVGGSKPQPIPKSDPRGRPLGEWAADEVLQTDPRSRGRGASVGQETMAEDPADRGGNDPRTLGATPGSEHLSALREGYLQRLAEEQGLGYLRLGGAAELARALAAPAMGRPVPVRVSLAPVLLALAGLLLVARHAGRGRPAWLRTPPPRP